MDERERFGVEEAADVESKPFELALVLSVETEMGDPLSIGMVTALAFFFHGAAVCLLEAPTDTVAWPSFEMLDLPAFFHGFSPPPLLLWLVPTPAFFHGRSSSVLFRLVSLDVSFEEDAVFVSATS